MLSEPRAIFFQTQLEWPPVELYDFRIGKDIVREFYNRLFDHEYEEHHYENLDLQAPRPTLSTRTETRQSICQFGDRSITIEERRPDFEVDGFTNVVEVALQGLKAVTDEIDDYDVPPFFLQRCRIHCLSQPLGTGSSLDLLASRVANVKEPIAPFQRPPSFFGVRFRFGPVILETDEDENTHIENFASVRFETYEEDPSQVWMEVATTYPLVHVPPMLGDAERIVANIRESYEFLAMRCKEFLDQFDTREEDRDQEGDGLSEE
ncbi:MAG: hypothetical protein ACYTG0_07930 [Planctomycetota bacterium]|jgi:hypothetical protein